MRTYERGCISVAAFSRPPRGCSPRGRGQTPLRKAFASRSSYLDSCLPLILLPRRSISVKLLSLGYRITIRSQSALVTGRSPRRPHSRCPPHPLRCQATRPPRADPQPRRISASLSATRTGFPSLLSMTYRCCKLYSAHNYETISTLTLHSSGTFSE